MGSIITAPAVLRAACALVDSAVGVANHVVIGGATLSVRRIVGLSLLCRFRVRRGGRVARAVRNLGEWILHIGQTCVLLGAVLACQALVGFSLGAVKFTGRVDPVKVDVGRGQPGKSAETENGGRLHDELETQAWCRPE